jgi:hypothetical protein
MTNTQTGLFICILLFVLADLYYWRGWVKGWLLRLFAKIRKEMRYQAFTGIGGLVLLSFVAGAAAIDVSNTAYAAFHWGVMPTVILMAFVVPLAKEGLEIVRRERAVSRTFFRGRIKIPKHIRVLRMKIKPPRSEWKINNKTESVKWIQSLPASLPTPTIA